MKLVKIRIYANFDFQNSSNVNANRGIYFISRNVMYWFRIWLQQYFIS